jgi:imidazolonepropionase-like amidohydrolase
MKYTIEYTDTFGGEANYSWVKRETVEHGEALSDKTIKSLAKRKMGLNGVRGEWTSLGDMLEFRPSSSCTVLFVIFN